MKTYAQMNILAMKHKKREIYPSKWSNKMDIEPFWLAHNLPTKIGKLPKIYVLMWSCSPPLWPTYIGENVQTLGKPYGINLWCYWEHIWEHGGRKIKFFLMHIPMGKKWTFLESTVSLVTCKFYSTFDGCHHFWLEPLPKSMGTHCYCFTCNYELVIIHIISCN
jgi:hypothetical protein